MAGNVGISLDLFLDDTDACTVLENEGFWYQSEHEYWRHRDNIKYLSTKQVDAIAYLVYYYGMGPYKEEEI